MGRQIINLVGQKFGKLTVLNLNKNDYINKNGRHFKQWDCVCDCGNITSVVINNLTNGHTHSCGCIDSVGESIIGRILSKYNILYIKEYTFPNCKDVHVLPFDFGIINNDNSIKALIEYDGLQHFKKVRFNGITDKKADEMFVKCKEHDIIKNNFCMENKIPLLRIKYTQRDNLENIIKEFIDNSFKLNGSDILA